MTEAAIVEKEDAQQEPEIEAVVEIEEKLQPIPISRLALQVEENNLFHVNVPQGTRPEQVMDESVWAHIAVRLQPNDEIVVMPDDGAWKLLLHVQNCGRNYAHVIKEVLYELAPTVMAPSLPSIYVIDYAGATHKWRVLREGRLLRDGLQSKSIAERYAANHEQVT